MAISNKFVKLEKLTPVATKNVVSFNSDGRISFTQNLWASLSVSGDDVSVEPRFSM